MTPCEFKRQAGRLAAKNWKKTIRYIGKSIGNFLQHSFSADGKKQLHFVTSSPPTSRASCTRSHRVLVNTRPSVSVSVSDQPPESPASPQPSVSGKKLECPASLSHSASSTYTHPLIRGQPLGISASPLHPLNTQPMVSGQQPESLASPSHPTSPINTQLSINAPQQAKGFAGVSHPANPITQPLLLSVFYNQLVY